jgi:hypothetical protein
VNCASATAKRRLLGAGAVDLTTTGRAIEAKIVADGEHRRVTFCGPTSAHRLSLVIILERPLGDIILDKPSRVPGLRPGLRFRERKLWSWSAVW